MGHFMRADLIKTVAEFWVILKTHAADAIIFDSVYVSCSLCMSLWSQSHGEKNDENTILTDKESESTTLLIQHWDLKP